MMTHVMVLTMMIGNQITLIMRPKIRNDDNINISGYEVSYVDDGAAAHHAQ